MEDGRSRVIRRGAGPLQAPAAHLGAVQPGVADAGEGRRQGGDLVHDLRGGHLLLGIAHAVHQVDDDVGIQAQIARHGDGLAHPLDPALGIAEGALLFGVGAAGEHYVGIAGRLRHKELLHHQEIQGFKGLDDVVGVRVGDDGVLAVNIESFDLSFDGGREHVRRVCAHFAVQGHAPGFFKFFAHGIIGHVLIAGEFVGHGTHVAGTLDVVLPPQRVDAAAAAAQLTNHHGHVGHGHNALGAGGMLRDAQAVDDGRFGGPGVQPRGPAQILRIDVADLRHALGRITEHDLFELFKALGAFGDKFLVDEPFGEKHVHHAIGKGHVRAGAELEVNVGALGKADVPGVHHDELRSPGERPADLHAHHGVGLLRVGAHQQDHVHILRDVGNGVRHGAGAQGHGQAGHGSAVAHPRAVVGVIAAKAGAHHFLHHVDILVGTAGARKARQGLGSVLLFDLHEFGGRQIQRRGAALCIFS